MAERMASQNACIAVVNDEGEALAMFDTGEQLLAPERFPGAVACVVRFGDGAKPLLLHRHHPLPERPDTRSRGAGLDDGIPPRLVGATLDSRPFLSTGRYSSPWPRSGSLSEKRRAGEHQPEHDRPGGSS